MSDFKLRFAHCSTTGDATSCEFSRVREGLIVSLLSIGTLIGALFGAPYVHSPESISTSVTVID
jgi:SP family sugar:H+ symporter-like MFS transporter